MTILAILALIITNVIQARFRRDDKRQIARIMKENDRYKQFEKKLIDDLLTPDHYCAKEGFIK